MGICCSVGDFLVAGIGSTVVFVVFLVFGMIKSDNRMLLIVRADRKRETGIESLIYQTFRTRAILRVRNTTEDSVEMIYELSAKVLRNAEKQKASISDALYRLGGMEYINMVIQNDEISN